MCGIVGVLSMYGQPVNLGALLDSLHSIQHRGPDDEGYLLVNTSRGNVAACSGPDSDPTLGLPRIEQCSDGQYDLAFGFRRLSILDLSSAGHQPMSSQVSLYPFALETMSVFGLDLAMITPVSDNYSPEIAPRPKDTSIDPRKIETELGFIPVRVRDGLFRIEAEGMLSQ